MSFYPDRHNREFTKDEIKILLTESGFRNIDAFYFAEKKLRDGFDKIHSIGSTLRDCIPTLQKHIIGFGSK